MNCTSIIVPNHGAPILTCPLKYRSGQNLKSFRRCEIRKDEPRPTLYEEQKTGILEGRHLLHKFTETKCCTCDSNPKCQDASECGYGCCALENDRNLALLDKHNFSCPISPGIVEARVREIGSTIKKTFDSIRMERLGELDCDCDPEYSDHGNEVKPSDPYDHRIKFKSPGVKSREVEKGKESSRVHHGNDCTKENNVCDCETAYHSGNECDDIPVFCDITAFPLLISKGQGLVEIHILALQLSAKASQTLFKDDSVDWSVFISWNIWGQETAFTPVQKYPSLTFKSSSVYRVNDLQSFFENVLREQIVFQVHVVSSRDKETFTIAEARLGVKDILDYPQNKLHFVTPVFGVTPCSCGGNFGQLSLWIRLSCDIDLVEDFKDRCGLASAVSKQKIEIPVQQRREGTGSAGSNKKIFLSIDSSKTVPEPHKNDLDDVPKVRSGRLDTIRESAEPRHRAEFDKKIVKKGKYRYQNPVEERPQLNIGRNDSSTNSIATNENYSENSEPEMDGNPRRSTVENIRLEALKKRYDSSDQIESRSIAEFNKVLNNQADSSLRKTDSTMKDLGTVISDDKWDTYKHNSQNISISLPGKSTDPKFTRIQEPLPNKNGLPVKDTITITIVAMNLFDRTSLMNNPEVDLLYVEYSFLGMRGADMETVSLPKPKNKGESMVFNFTRKFQIDEEYHYTQRNMLVSMLTGKESPLIKFFIVSEPHPDEVDTKECDEVGYADLNIREYALGDGLRDITLMIMNPAQSEELGMLKITIDGIEIIRNCMMVQKRL